MERFIKVHQMERRKAEFLQEVIFRYLRQAGLETPLNEYRVMQAWGSVAGAVAERYTESLQVSNQVLFVRLRSAVLRAELAMQRASLVERLNQAVGAKVIYDIRLV